MNRQKKALPALLFMSLDKPTKKIQETGINKNFTQKNHCICE